jgi:hypothetical protein
MDPVDPLPTSLPWRLHSSHIDATTLATDEPPPPNGPHILYNLLSPSTLQAKSKRWHFQRGCDAKRRCQCSSTSGQGFHSETSHATGRAAPQWCPQRGDRRPPGDTVTKAFAGATPTCYTKKWPTTQQQPDGRRNHPTTSSSSRPTTTGHRRPQSDRGRQPPPPAACPSAKPRHKSGLGVPDQPSRVADLVPQALASTEINDATVPPTAVVARHHCHLPWGNIQLDELSILI